MEPYDALTLNDGTYTSEITGPPILRIFSITYLFLSFSFKKHICFDTHYLSHSNVLTIWNYTYLTLAAFHSSPVSRNIKF